MTGPRAAVPAHCSSRSQPDSSLDDCEPVSFHLVLGRLELVSRQLEGLAAGQRVLEAVVRQIHREVLAPTQDGQATPWNPGSSEASSHMPLAPSGVVGGAGPSSVDDMLTRVSFRFDEERRQETIAVEASNSAADVEARFKVQKREELKRKENNEVQSVRLGRLTLSPMSLLDPTRKQRARCRFQALHPDSRRRAVFDITSIVVLLWESVFIPYTLAWGAPGFRGWQAVARVLAASFWAVDLLLAFVTGFRRKEEMVIDFPSIAKSYLKSYFIPNLLVVITDLASILLDSYGDVGDWPMWIKITRVLKLNRVFKVEQLFNTGRVAQLWDLLVTRFRRMGVDEPFNVTVRVCKLICLILWVNHLGCCVWHVVGKTASDNWYVANEIDADFYIEYMVGFFWSTSATMTGNSIMNPTNTGELICTILFVLFGFIFSSILISSLLTAVMDYTESNRERSDKLKLLRQFLCQHSVHSTLAMPIEKQANDRLSSVRRLAERDVAALQLISPQFRLELMVNMYGPSLNSHAFIRICNVISSAFISDLCYCALTHEPYDSGAVVFKPFAEAMGARFVYWGALEYLPAVSGRSGQGTQALSQDSKEAARRKVCQGEWVSEVALWATWQHLGMLEASSPCELLLLSGKEFLDTLAKHHPGSLLPLAQEFSTALLSAIEQETCADKANDVQLPVQHTSIVSAMPLNERKIMSLAALAVLERSRWKSSMFFNREDLEALEREVQGGECDLFVEPDERVFRVVTIVALRLVNPDGFVLAQIGKVVRGQVQARCSLPGTKIKPGERPTDAVQRLLREKLRGGLGEAVASPLRRTDEADEEARVSKSHGVSSRYVRTVFHAKLRQDCAYETCVLEPKGQVLLPSTPSSGVLKTWTSFESVPDRPQAFALGNMETSSSLFIYAWLTPVDFDLLQARDSGDAAAQRWVASLNTEALEELSRRLELGKGQGRAPGGGGDS